MLFGSGRAGFSRCLFRRDFELGELPGDAPARVTADSRYVLFVNGTEVGQIVDGHLRPAASQAANAVAVVSGLAPAARRRSTVPYPYCS
jgi:hypothetical protein